MKHAEQTPKSPAAKTGLFATLSNLLRSKGGGAPSRRLVVLLALALTAVLALTAAPASAATAYPKIGEIIGPGSGPFGRLLSESVAVNDKNGHILVADSGTGLVYDFTSASDTSPSTWDGSAAANSPGTPAGSFGGGRIAVAVANESGDVYVADSTHAVIDKFSSSGAYECQITGAGSSSTSTSECDANPNPAENPATPAGFFSPPGAEPADGGTFGIAVDQATGDLYAIDASHEVIDVFDPTGKYFEQIAAAPGGLYGCGAAYTDGIAINDKSEQVLFSDSCDLAVYRFELTGAFLEPAITGSDTPAESFGGGYTSLAADNASGHIYVADTSHEVVDPLDSTGAYTGSQITGTGTTRGLAVDQASGDVYAADTNAGLVRIFEPIVVPDATTLPPTGVDQTTATLNGELDPAGGGPITDCHFVVSGGIGNVPCAQPTPIEAAGPVSATVALQPNTSYTYRLLAANAKGKNEGAEEPLRTPGPPLIESQSASSVTASSATLEATVNPESFATSYHFQYLTEAAYQANLKAELDPFAGAASAPIPDAPLGSGEADIAVSQRLRGLSPATVYRYRVLATNSLGATEGAPLTFTTQAASAASLLPDARQWEMVSPSDKQGAGLQPIAEVGLKQAAAAGDAIAYIASSPTEAEPPSNANDMQVLSRRGPGGWESRDINATHNAPTGSPGLFGDEYRFFSNDLSLGLIQPYEASFNPLSPEASEQTPYLRSNYPPGDPAHPCLTSCYRPLVTGAPGFANVPPNTVFGECAERAQCGPVFVGASADLSHVVIQSAPALTAPPAGPGGLYEWSAGNLALLSILPDGEAVDAESQPALGSQEPFGTASGRGRHAADAISGDGSRVVFSEKAGEHHLYLRQNADQPQSALSGGECTEPAKACTIQLDAVQGGSEAGPVEPLFQTASSDGSRVFFTDTQALTPSSGHASGPQGPTDLYECEIVAAAGQPKCKLTDLTPPGAGEESAAVQGAILGASADGSYLYFVAKSVLAGENAAGATPVVGAPNLYLRHHGSTTLLAVLSAADSPDWEEGLSNQPTRVSPDGRWLAFSSQRSLTGYDNRDARSAQPDQEIYLYHASAGSGEGALRCASCNPTGARPTGIEYGRLAEARNGNEKIWDLKTWVAATVPGWTSYRAGQAFYQSRYLSDSGRLFFNSSDALVAQDSNGNEDVYQYEPPAGEGEPASNSCSASSPTYSVVSEGCVDLISSGTSGDEESVFLDASESGDDVFFLTTAQLSSADTNTSVDLYDAHACSAAAPCFPPPPPPTPACAGDACQAPTEAPNEPTLSTSVPSGPGNLTAKHHKKHKKHHKKRPPKRHGKRTTAHGHGGRR